ncbi:MAG: PEP-CTERM sorting domain-containing protein [Planctomycetia bacterium]|nr:PEP-CTERM sorting domain-containing protein [Planctomycetia bacterium]
MTQIHEKTRRVWLWVVVAIVSSALTSKLARGQVTSTWDGNILLGNWTDGTRWSTAPVYPNNGQPLPGDTYNAVITAGNVELDQDIAIQAFTHSGVNSSPNTNTLRDLSLVDHTLTVNGAYNWTGGDLYGAVTVDAMNGITISGNDLKRMRVESVAGIARIPMVKNHATATWTGIGVNSTVVSIGPNIFYPLFSNLSGATFDARSDGFFNVQFNNQGTFTRTTGTGTVRFQAPFNNDGTVTVSSGGLELNTGGTSNGSFVVNAGRTIYFFGTHNLTASSSVTGDGTVRFSNPSGQGTAGYPVIAGTYNVAATNLDGRLQFDSASGTTGTLLINNLLGGTPTQGSGTLNVTGLTTYQFGNFTGNFTLNAQSGVNFAINTNPRWNGSSKLNLAGGTSTWTGVFSILEFAENAQLNVLAGATFTVDNAIGSRVIKTFSTGGAFSNAGTLQKTGAGTLSIEIPATNTGLVNAQGGAVNFVAGLTQSNTNSEIRLSGGNVGGSLVLNAGSLTGSGNLTGSVASSGTISPGLSAGTLNFQSGLTLNSGGAVAVQLGGLTPGTQYDQLNVTGGATLGGTLAVTLINGFQPALADSFTVMTFDSGTGTFGGYTGLAVGGHLTLKPRYSATDLALRARPTVDGDINLDGIVDISDVQNVAANWLTAGPAGDADDSGFVDISDIQTIAAHWLQTDGGGSGVAVVPEPSTLVLAGMAALGALVWRPRAARRVLRRP